MKSLPIYQVDVFTKEYYKGNPAAVCILENELKDSQMKSIAAEMNLSETAFLLPIEGDLNTYSLRWFTPEVEVPLCGHGTIATATVLFDELGINGDKINFQTKSGKVSAKKSREGIAIDFPIDKPIDFKLPKGLLEAIGIKEYEDVKIGKNTRKIIIRVKDYNEIKELQPDFEQMKNISTAEGLKGIAVTTKGNEEYDFISRYFNPWAGVNEDPVTGSVHTVLADYWGRILNKREMLAYQASARAGEIKIEIKENRVELIGEAIIVLKGEIYTPLKESTN